MLLLRVSYHVSLLRVRYRVLLLRVSYHVLLLQSTDDVMRVTCNYDESWTWAVQEPTMNCK